MGWVKKKKLMDGWWDVMGWIWNNPFIHIIRNHFHGVIIYSGIEKSGKFTSKCPNTQRDLMKILNLLSLYKPIKNAKDKNFGSNVDDRDGVFIRRSQNNRRNLSSYLCSYIWVSYLSRYSKVTSTCRASWFIAAL